MDEPWKHAQWNTPDTKGQTLYGFTYMKYLEQVNLWRQKAARGYQGLGKEGKWKVTAFWWQNFCLGWWKGFGDSNEGCTTYECISATELYT